MNKLSDELKETVSKLKYINEAESTQIDVTALKELRRFCNAYSYTANDSLERTISFIIAKYLDDIFNNFFIDTTYTRELHNARIIIYKDLCENLPKLEDELNNRNFENILKILNRIFEIYVEQINYLNRHFQI
jgi:hypothetical protein